MDLILFSVLFSLLLGLLLSMLMVWAWTIRRLWSGRPLLTDVPCFSLRDAPWGAMTVLSVLFLYLLVNAAVSRAYSATTGRHSRERRRGQAEGPGRSACRDGGIGRPGCATQTDLLIQLAIINGILVMLVPVLVRYAAGPGLPTSG